MAENESVSRDARRPSPKLNGKAAKDALPVTWLADLCELPAVDRVPILASTLLRRPQSRAVVSHYLSWWIRHPARGSQFERAVLPFRDMPDEELIVALQSLQYDGLLFRIK